MDWGNGLCLCVRGGVILSLSLNSTDQHINLEHDIIFPPSPRIRLHTEYCSLLGRLPVDEQVKSYRRRANNIRGGSQSKADKDGARSSVKSVNVMQQRLEGAESELLKQTVRRRELETELNAARKRENAASPSGRHRRG